MLSLFRTNHLMLSVLLILYALIYQAGSLTFGIPEVTGAAPTGVLTTILLTMIGDSYFALTGILIVCLFLQGTIANSFFMEHRITTPGNLFPGVFLVLACCVIPSFLNLSGYHFANIFLLLSMMSLANSHRKTKAADNVFNAGLWMGLAILFQPEYLLLTIVGWITLGIMRSTNLKESLILFIGICCPIFIGSFFFFWHDAMPQFLSTQFYEAFGLPSRLYDIGNLPWIEIGVLFVLTIVTLLSASVYKNKTTTEVKKKIELISWFQFGALFVLLFSSGTSMLTFLIMMPFTGMLLSMNFTKMKVISAEAIHLVLLVIIIGFQFAQGWNFF